MNTFDELIALTNGAGPRNLLLGNGYSIAASENFNYSNLFQKTIFSSMEWIVNIFNKYQTCNFEFILEVLKHAENVNEEIVRVVLGESKAHLSNQVDIIHSARINLVSSFINTLRTIHPENNHLDQHGDGITGDMFIKNREFLRNFSKFFTLNYDLLLYWSLLNSEIVFADNFSSGLDYKFNDNFSQNTTLWFLHGALHLRTDRFTGQTRKVVYRSQSTLLRQLADDLINSMYPTIVFEGTASEKRSKIGSNTYLSMANQHLASLGGSLFTFGFSFNDNDAHMQKAIADSDISMLCVGIRGSEQNNLHICGKCREIQTLADSKRAATLSPPLQVYFYNTSEMSIW